MHITPGGPCEHQEKSIFNLYVPRITHINFLLTILTQWFMEKVMRINKMRKYFHKFSQLIFKETYGDQSRELVQSNFHYQPPLHNCRCHYSMSPTAKVTSWQWPVFFQWLMMVMKFDRSEWHMDDCRNHFDCIPFNTASLSMKLSTILKTNVGSLARLVTLAIWFKLFLCILALYIIFVLGLPLWDTVGMKIGTINMLYTPKISCHIAPLPPHNGHLSTMTTFFCPQGGRCGGVQLYVDITIMLRGSC